MGLNGQSAAELNQTDTETSMWLRDDAKNCLPLLNVSFAL